MSPTTRSTLVDDVRCLPYFHNDLDNKDAKKILCTFIEDDGCFLLRPSSSENQACTFSVTNQKSILHVKLFKSSSNQYYLEVDKKNFPSVQRLVAHYAKSPIPCENYTNMKFIYPITSNKQTNLKRISIEPDDVGVANRPLPAPPLEQTETNDTESVEICQCGLKKSSLIDGWTVHVSHEPVTRGLLFFQHTNGSKVWELPISVATLLGSEEINYLKANGYRGALS